ncbi:YjdF family protein [Desulfosporosinus hippei]|uniref:DUF2992 family protein n=1 Tax=Desulfosporosinus hippei DSM 8344 TaxID=1121419 RepID=A0A1G8KVW0_9FIRM|nr:Protein of unknown function [Desulfosporosinus hippei DSM 8344]
MSIKSYVTVFFEDPYWVAVCERVYNDKLEVARIVFGGEPKDYEIYEFLLHNWSNLKFSLPIVAEKVAERRVNPKRVQKLINKQVSNNGVGTKAQQALKLQHEEAKIERRGNNSEKWKAEEQMKFKLRQEKKKEKHKGR